MVAQIAPEGKSEFCTLLRAGTRKTWQRVSLAREGLLRQRPRITRWSLDFTSRWTADFCVTGHFRYGAGIAVEAAKLAIPVIAACRVSENTIQNRKSPPSPVDTIS